MKPETVLVTGGAGFIGSHTCVELLDNGNDVVVIDDYSNSHPSALDRVREITGKSLAVYEVDLRDRAGLSAVFEAHSIDSVIHFAAKKAVGESTQIPLEYFDINIGGTTNLIRTMHQHQVTRLVFSSSCSIYGDSSAAPLSEADPANPTNPYARSKWICEQVLTQACTYIPELSVIALRYFNPIGAHPSGRLGEDPIGVPNNVMPYLSQIAVGRLTELSVFGDDYAGFLIAILPPGAFFALGMLIAAFNAINVRLAARARRQPPPATAHKAPEEQADTEPAAAS